LHIEHLMLNRYIYYIYIILLRKGLAVWMVESSGILLLYMYSISDGVSGKEEKK
jgi:hypothetical protein